MTSRSWYLLGLGACLALGLSCARLGRFAPQGTNPNWEPLRPLWSKNLDPAYETGNLPIALNSPVINQGILYVGDGSGNMTAYDADRATRLWSSFDGGNYHARPLAFKDQLLYGSNQGRLYSRHFLTGEKKYEVDLGSPIESQPTLYEGRLFVHLRNHQVFCLDADSGKILWAYRRSVAYTTTIQRVSQPIVYDKKLYVGFADGSVGALNLEEGLLLWETKLATGSKFVDVDATPVFYKGQLVIGSLAGQLKVLNPMSGKIERSLDYTVSRAPLIYKDNLVLGTTDGKFVLLDASFKPVVEKSLSKGSISSVVQWQQYFVVATLAGEVFVLGQDQYQVVQTKHLGHVNSAVFGELVATNDKLVFLSSRNRLYVFGGL